MSAAETAAAPSERATNLRANTAIVALLADAGRPMSIAEVHATWSAEPATPERLLAMRKRLMYLTYENRLQTHGTGDSRTWSASRRNVPAAPETDVQPRVAEPRSINVLLGDYKPLPGPVLRPGALDYQRIQSVGYRC